MLNAWRSEWVGLFIQCQWGIWRTWNGNGHLIWTLWFNPGRTFRSSTSPPSESDMSWSEKRWNHVLAVQRDQYWAKSVSGRNCSSGVSPFPPWPAGQQSFKTNFIGIEPKLKWRIYLKLWLYVKSWVDPEANIIERNNTTFRTLLPKSILENHPPFHYWNPPSRCSTSAYSAM